ncbi:hypothetical protein ACVWW6_006047 [Bradyrhizobium sp. USDA 3311]
MATRRRFLALLGVGSVSAPIAAKAAAEAEAAKLAGISGGLSAGAGGSLPSTCAPSADSGLRWLPYEERLEKIALYVRTVGLPRVVEQEFWERARSVTALDPDIAGKRSWSLAAKIHEQRQRNYRRLLDEIEARPVQLAKRSAFQKLLGFELPW